MHSGCPFFCCAVYLRWNEHCGQFSASCNIEIQKKLFSINKLEIMFDALWMSNFLLCCLFKMKWTLWTVFSKLQHWNTEITFFHKQARNHVDALWMSNFLLCCPFKTKWTLWTVFSKVATLKYRKKFFTLTSSKSCLMYSGCPIFCCAVYLRWNEHCGQF